MVFIGVGPSVFSLADNHILFGAILLPIIIVGDNLWAGLVLKLDIGLMATYGHKWQKIVPTGGAFNNHVIIIIDPESKRPQRRSLIGLLQTFNLTGGQRRRIREIHTLEIDIRCVYFAVMVRIHIYGQPRESVFPKRVTGIVVSVKRQRKKVVGRQVAQKLIVRKDQPAVFRESGLELLATE